MISSAMRIFVADSAERMFGVAAWGTLSNQQRHLLIADIYALAQEECEGSIIAAIQVLRGRIGGSKNLPAYARTLEAGHNTSEEN